MLITSTLLNTVVKNRKNTVSLPQRLNALLLHTLTAALHPISWHAFPFSQQSHMGANEEIKFHCNGALTNRIFGGLIEDMIFNSMKLFA